ncbi:MAG: cytochrome P450 [Gammaproteobacteria bacterium]|nr:cytochrome P450 [Gammaproteobacteria bacterium]
MTLVTIDTYHAANEALKQKDLRQALYDEGAVIMNKVLVNLHGDEHRTRRNVETQVFRRDFFRYYEHEVFPRTLEETIAPFLPRGKRSGEMDVVDFGYRVMVNLTVDFTGIDRPTRSPEETEQLIDMLRLFSRTAILAHSTQDRDAIRSEALTALDRFQEEYVDPSVARRLTLLERVKAGELAEDDLPRDILMVLLKHQNEVQLADDVRLREMAFFALAGAHTSIHTLGHVMHEIFTWCDAHPEDRRRFENDPLFVQRAVHESIRLHPSSPVAARRSLCPVHLRDGDVETDTAVNISLHDANRDPAVFGSDAAQFNPHRTLTGKVSPYGLSFGLGMHACLGLNLAAGSLPKPDTDPAEHHYGTIAMIVRTLLDHDARPKPASPPAKDTTTARDLWATYPITLG